ncbi:MarR family winged helix-turn-helix transcriptional regulator [Moritella viscosa]|uniref:HTH-type transcriptional regulator SarZ n=1 Tax=Moritella viscosa TaxID=80854 RepID=A0A1L0BVR4_9GAMM|nr:MarR family transcriptional regulator [Moritella viscosa]SGZ03951.1 Transcription regulator [Moritella viscosa]
MFKDIPSKSIGLQFWKLYTKWNNAIYLKLEPLGLTHTQFVILATIFWCEKENIIPSQSKISTLTSIDKMTLSKALKKLVEDHLVLKKKSKNDNRMFILNLSESGRNLTRKTISIVEGVDEDFFTVLGVEKKNIFSSLVLSFNNCHL